jgi:hypothetical protein
MELRHLRCFTVVAAKPLASPGWVLASVAEIVDCQALEATLGWGLSSPHAAHTRGDVDANLVDRRPPCYLSRENRPGHALEQGQ